MQEGKKENDFCQADALNHGTLLRFIRDYRRIVSIVLSLLGVAVIIRYYFCGTSCLYLAGTLLGLDLKLWGVIFLGLFSMLLLLRQEALSCLLLSAALGCEVFLVGYQVIHRNYCPYCLIFAGIILVLFVVNLNKKKLILGSLSIVLGFVVMLAFFQSVPLNVASGGQALPSFGQGEVRVRLYTDYFCGPCRGVEPAAESVLYDLARKNRINLTFVDMPIHRSTSLYTAYYLSLVQRGKALDRALQIRKALFQAAEKRIQEEGALRAYLEKRGFEVKGVDEKLPPPEIGRFVHEDEVNGTPTLVVIEGREKKKYFGRTEVLQGLHEIK
ncbi:MAG: hypothetical protein WCX84_08055 [Syntrophales bacterium]|jgi:thiol:disulfide interchange protein DsbA|nr:thioredoxin domain-containing protein [Syntrophales bacterium]